MANKDKRLILEQILTDAKSNPEFFEDVLEASGMSPRTITQLYMMYKFKWNLGCQIGRDPKYEVTNMQWAEQGLAKRFDEIYSPDKSIRQLYEELKLCMNCKKGSYVVCKKECEYGKR